MTADRPVHPVRLAALLALLAMFGPFAIDAFFPAFHTIARDFEASPWAMQQTISVYLVAYAAMALFHGALSDAFGRRRVVIVGVALFTLSSIGCALSQTIGQLLVFRAIQGMSTGAGQIVGRAIVRDLYHGPQAQKVMSLITVFFAVAPALAPIVGGVVYTAMGWHAVFGFLAAYGALLLVLCLRSLPETHPPGLRTPFAAGPLLRVYTAIVRDGRFMLLVLASGFNFCAQFLYISSAPDFIERHLRLGTMGYSWFFVPMVLGMMTGAAISHRLAGVLAPRDTVRAGYLVMGAAAVINVGYNLLVDPIDVPWAVLPIALNAIGVAMTFPVISLKCLDRHPRNRGSAASMQAFLWGVMTGVVAGALSPVVSYDHRLLAIAAVGLMLCGLACWVWYVTTTAAMVHSPEPAPADEPLEPT